MEINNTESWLTEPVILGLDLGSTGAKAVLTSVKDGAQLLCMCRRCCWQRFMK